MAASTERLILDGEPKVEVRLRRSARARRLSLRVSRLDGRVTLSLPKSVGVGQARAFLEERADWVRGHLLEQPRPYVPRIGGTLPVRGDSMPIVAGRRAMLTDDQLVVRDDRPVPAQVKAVLRQAARDELTQACDHYADALGARYGRITLRDTRSRWGSCTSTGNLMFSWRLIMAPHEVLDYVAAHEAAHLREMNHGPRFWALVGQICPNYLNLRGWLKDNGAEIHRIKFNE